MPLVVQRLHGLRSCVQAWHEGQVMFLIQLLKLRLL